MKPTPKIEKEIEGLAYALGIDPQEIKVRQPEWVSLMKRGVIVELHLRRWRAVGTLTAEHLGILFADEAEEKAFSDSLKLGNIFLLPSKMVKELNSIDSAARKSVEKYAFKTYWGNMMTGESFQDWQADLEKYKSRYYAVRDTIMDEFTEIIGSVAISHQVNARAAYRRLIMAGHTLDIDAETFVNRYVDAVMAQIPTSANIYDSFDFEVSLSYIPLPSLLAEDKANAEIETVRAQAEERKAMAELRMHEAILKNYQERMDELVVGHLSDLAGQLNEILYTAASDVLSAIRGKNGQLHPRSVVQLRDAIEKIKSLNILDFPDLEKMVMQAETVLGNVDTRNVKDVESKLRDIAIVTREIGNRLDVGPDRARRESGVELPTDEVFKAATVRQARQRLGLDVKEFETAGRRGRSE